jgi:hypothetical protein
MTVRVPLFENVTSGGTEINSVVGEVNPTARTQFVMPSSSTTAEMFSQFIGFGVVL